MAQLDKSKNKKEIMDKIIRFNINLGLETNGEPMGKNCKIIAWKN